jgi:hypothetical protein
MVKDQFDNPHAPGLPYAHGEYNRSSKKTRFGSKAYAQRPQSDRHE